MGTAQAIYKERYDHVAKRILLVDDEPLIIKGLKFTLEKDGYETLVAADGEEALQVFKENQVDLILLDVMLPKLDGIAVCQRIRETSNVPIIMLTAKGEDIDKILGLEYGADDYMTKPFNPRELVARVKAILRRSVRAAEAQTEDALRAGDLAIDSGRREVRVKGALIDLRTQEFEVLLVLARRPGQVFSREKLLELAWGYDFYGQTRTVDVHVAQLRRKLSTGSSDVRIETVTGIGYKLVV